MSAGTWWGLRRAVRGVVTLLDEVWSEEHAPYPFTMSVVDGRYASGWTRSSRGVPAST